MLAQFVNHYIILGIKIILMFITNKNIGSKSVKTEAVFTNTEMNDE